MCVEKNLMEIRLRRQRKIAAVVVCGFWVSFTPVGNSAPLKLPEGDYPYSVVEQDLPLVLKEFGHNVGVEVDISTKVQGRIRGRLPRSSAKDFLDGLCESYSLDWYFDGYSLHISSSSEKVSRFLPLRSFSSDDLQNALRLLGFADDRYALRPGPDGKSVIAYGPPHYVDLVERTLLSLPHPENLRVARSEAVTQTVIYRGANSSVVRFVADKVADKK